MASNMLWFWAGAGFTWLVLPSIKLYFKRRREFEYIKQNGSDPDAAKEGLKRLVHVIKQIDASEVKTLVVSMESYDESKSYLGFGGRASNIADAIRRICEELALRVPNDPTADDGE